jgi:hypothetical protein
VMATPLPDGRYTDLLSDRAIEVRDGEMMTPETAVILRYNGRLNTDAHRQPSRFL